MDALRWRSRWGLRVHLSLLVVVLLLVSHFILRFIETPIRRALYRRLDKPRAPFSK